MQEFKLIIAGGRDFNDSALLQKNLQHLKETALVNHSTSVVSGMARGADALAYNYAKQAGIRCYEFPADWNRYGKRAGFLRNEQMAVFADGLLAFWDGKSRGTQHMIETMQRLGKSVRIVRY